MGMGDQKKTMLMCNGFIGDVCVHYSLSAVPVLLPLFEVFEIVELVNCGSDAVKHGDEIPGTLGASNLITSYEEHFTFPRALYQENATVQSPTNRKWSFIFC